MNRLDDLMALRRRIDREISKELDFQRRIELVRAQVDRASLERSHDWTARILNAVANAYGVDVDEMTSASRTRDATQARAIAAWLLRQDGRSLTDIGKVLHKDHTTILHAVRKVDASKALQDRAADAKATAREAA